MTLAIASQDDPHAEATPMGFKFTRMFLAVAGIAALAGPQAAVAQSTAPPRFVMACAACHGFDGIGHDGSVPNLAGQHRGYLLNQLLAFRDGHRTHPVMNFFSNQMSQDEMQQIIEFYAGLPGP